MIPKRIRIAIKHVLGEKHISDPHTLIKRFVENQTLPNIFVSGHHGRTS
jgi:hypothetical protein